MPRPPLPPRDDYLGRLGGRIRAARERRRLTVPDAAARAGVAATTWYKYEAGDRWPDLLAIARAFGLKDPLDNWPR